MLCYQPNGTNHIKGYIHNVYHFSDAGGRSAHVGPLLCPRGAILPRTGNAAYTSQGRIIIFLQLVMVIILT